MNGYQNRRALLAIVSAMLLPACSRGVTFGGTSLDQKAVRVELDQEFPAALVADAAVTYQPAFGLVDEQITLAEKPPIAANLRQLDRPMAVKEAVQGDDGSARTQTFSLSSVGKVDVLIVSDNSGSMADEQAALAANLKGLTKFLKTTDWQIGVITTDQCILRNGNKPIKSTDATAEADFVAAINAGTAGYGYERGIFYAMKALRVNEGYCPGGNTTWLRPDAALAIVFLSDEDNYCTTATCADNDGPDALIAYLKTLTKPVKSYALVWKTGDPLCKNPNGEHQGDRYLKVVQEIGGLDASLCLDNDPATEDYAPFLETISKDVSRIVIREFELATLPISTSLSVKVDNQPYADFAVAGKKVVVNNTTGAQNELAITYRHDPKPKFDRVTLDAVPASGTLEASINDTPVPATALSFDPATKNVIFNAMPPNSAKVKLKYRANQTLPTTFDLGAPEHFGKVTAVTVAGQDKPGFTVNGSQLTLPQAPGDGAEIKVLYERDDKRLTNYPAPTSQLYELAKGITARDAATSAPVDFQYANGELIFAEDDVWAGRQVTVTYDYGDAATVLAHELADDPLDGMVQIDAASGCVGNVAVEGRKVSYQCNGEALGDVKIGYKYVKERYRSFTVDGEMPDNPQIRVLIDGVPTTEFTREGNTFTLPETAILGLESKVRIVIGKEVIQQGPTTTEAD